MRAVRSLEEALRRVRFEAAFVLAVTVSVLLLSSAGLYALMSFTVSQRRREIGIRVALGASRASIVSSIFSRALLQLGAWRGGRVGPLGDLLQALWRPGTQCRGLSRRRGVRYDVGRSRKLKLKTL